VTSGPTYTAPQQQQQQQQPTVAPPAQPETPQVFSDSG
jgi:hypothetical protein